jgi:hypothetical protein
MVTERSLCHGSLIWNSTSRKYCVVCGQVQEGPFINKGRCDETFELTDLPTTDLRCETPMGLDHDSHVMKFHVDGYNVEIRWEKSPWKT